MHIFRGFPMGSRIGMDMVNRHYDPHRSALVKLMMNSTREGYKTMKIDKIQKNLLGKSRTKDNPYATFEGEGPFGNTTVHLLKTYQKPAKELENAYARWFVAVSSDFTYGSYDIGDSYLRDVIRGLTITYSSHEFKQNYPSWISDRPDLENLLKYSGFIIETKKEHKT